MATATDAKTLAESYIEAVGRKDFDFLPTLFHPDLEFRLGKDVWDKDGFVAALRRLTAILERNEILKTFVDGDEVCVIYDFVTDTPVGPVPSVEWITVEAGQIRTIRLIFERERWPEVMEELNRRTAVPS